MDLVILFLSALGASTILPMSSEAVLAALRMAGTTDRTLLLLVATVGNTAGAVINWLLGRYAGAWVERRAAGQRATFERAAAWFQRFGLWSLLLSWLPVVGDPLTLLAGLLRTRFLPFVVLVLIGKAARYAVILIAAG